MPTLEEKCANAIDAVDQMIVLLERCSEKGWSGRFRAIRNALTAGDLAWAIQQWSQTPMGTMGGLLDLILCVENGHTVRDLNSDNELLGKLVGCVSQTLANIRVFTDYKIDKPIVHVPSGA